MKKKRKQSSLLRKLEQKNHKKRCVATFRYIFKTAMKSMNTPTKANQLVSPRLIDPVTFPGMLLRKWTITLAISRADS